MERARATVENDPKLPEKPFPDLSGPVSFQHTTKAFDLLTRLLRLRVVPDSLDEWRYEDLLRWLDRPLLSVLVNSGAQSTATFTERVNRRRPIKTKPNRTGIYGMTPDTSHAWLTSAWRRGLVSTLPQAQEGSGLGLGPLWTATEDGRRRLRSPVAVFVARFPLTRIVPVVTAAAGGIYAWATKHVDVVEAIAAGLALLVGYLLFLWLLVSVVNWTKPAAALVVIETHRGRHGVPSLLDTLPDNGSPD
jgi:hypothetical protein